MLRNTAWTPVLDRLKARCQEAESERDALRAEVERYKRAVDVLSDYFCPPIGSARCEQFCEKYSDCNDCMVEWALSEAGK